MTIHERHNVETAKLRLMIAKLQLQVSELTENNGSLQRSNDRLTSQLDDACDRITRLQEIVDDCEERYAIHVERFATMKTAENESALNQELILEEMTKQYETRQTSNNETPETETTDNLILTPQETKPIDPNEVW